MTTSAPAQRRSHLRCLAAEHSVSLRIVDTWAQACAYPALREVCAPDAGLDEASYLIGLHEFGHVLQPWALDLEEPGASDNFSYLARECLAWSWAAQHALSCASESWARVLSDSLLAHFARALNLSQEPSA